MDELRGELAKRSLSKADLKVELKGCLKKKLWLIEYQYMMLKNHLLGQSDLIKDVNGVS